MADTPSLLSSLSPASLPFFMSGGRYFLFLPPTLYYLVCRSVILFVEVLGLPVGETGVAAAIPFALSALLKVVSGPVSDRMSKCISDKANVIIFSSISQVWRNSDF